MTSPEERELESKKAILAELEEDLAGCELEYATLAAELLAFQRIYVEAVGELIAELDELEAQIAEVRARRQPKDEASEHNAEAARNRAAESARAYNEESKASLPKSEFIPTEDLQRLFRNVAKKIHPDLASNDADHAIREEMMKRANEAYQNSDVEKLRSILEEYEARPESVEGDDIGAKLVRVIRKIDLVNRRIVEIRNETKKLMGSELFILKKKFSDAKSENRNLLSEMATYLQRKIRLAKTELKNARSRVIQ